MTQFRTTITRKKPSTYHGECAARLTAVTMVAFAPLRLRRCTSPKGLTPNPRLVVCARTKDECLYKLKRICRDYRLPMRKTMATARVTISPYDMRHKRRRATR